MPVARIGDMRRDPGRTQLHAGRHIPAPERHRLAEHADRHIGGAQMRGHGEAVRPGAYDGDIAGVTGMDGADGDIHGGG